MSTSICLFSDHLCLKRKHKLLSCCITDLKTEYSFVLPILNNIYSFLSTDPLSKDILTDFNLLLDLISPQNSADKKAINSLKFIFSILANVEFTSYLLTILHPFFERVFNFFNFTFYNIPYDLESDFNIDFELFYFSLDSDIETILTYLRSL